MSEKIEHLIVLMLENRSFDNMLGFLKHPNKKFEGLSGKESNIIKLGEPPIFVSDDSDHTINPDPAHDHESVMQQITGIVGLPKKPYIINNSGFAANHELKSAKKFPPGNGAKVMKCHKMENVPVLSKLALEFAVCDHWFSSVPGQTWPNRFFALTGQSKGQVNIRIGLNLRRTIFEDLEENAKSWSIYHDDIALTFDFPKLLTLKRRKNFKSMQEFHNDVINDQLPNFSFIEPNYFGNDSNSQHPSENEEGNCNFISGENLIQEIYSSLYSNYKVFKKTLFVITYDEHGGLYDHVPPPVDDKYKVDPKDYYNTRNYKFDFSVLGARVPTVLISPFIPKNTLDQVIYDHSSIVATCRALFAPDTKPFSNREMHANKFINALSLTEPRSKEDLPKVNRNMEICKKQIPLTDKSINQMDEFQLSILKVGQNLDKYMRRENLKKSGFNYIAGDQVNLSPLRNEITTIQDADNFQKDVVRSFREFCDKK